MASQKSTVSPEAADYPSGPPSVAGNVAVIPQRLHLHHHRHHLEALNLRGWLVSREGQTALPFLTTDPPLAECFPGNRHKCAVLPRFSADPYGLRLSDSDRSGEG
jgi:hypothetical protein